MSSCNSAQNKLRMCPCSREHDIPKNSQDGMEDSDEIHEIVEGVPNGGDVVLSSDSGSDEELDALAAQGYVSLPQCEDDVNTNSEINLAEQESCVDDAEESSEVEPEGQKVELESGPSSPSLAFSSYQNTQMDEEEINLIKSVMMNIQLPSSAIPEWAKKIPEEKWKAPLVTALHQRSSKNNDNTDKTLESCSKTT